MKKLISNIKLKISDANGFTLVELLVFMGIFSILIVVLTQIFLSALNVQLETQATSSVQQDGRYILARLAYDINRAKNITEPATPGTSSHQLQLTIGGSNYKYAAIGNLLRLTVDTDTPVQLNSFQTTISNISDLNFKRVGAGSTNGTTKDSIQINFTLTSSSKSQSGAEVKTFQTAAGLRGN